MTPLQMIVRVLEGDDAALAELEALHAPMAGRAVRTRDRLKGLGTACAAAVEGVEDRAERERLIRIEFERALMELAPAPKNLS